MSDDQTDPNISEQLAQKYGDRITRLRDRAEKEVIEKIERELWEWSVLEYVYKIAPEGGPYTIPTSGKSVEGRAPCIMDAVEMANRFELTPTIFHYLSKRLTTLLFFNKEGGYNGTVGAHCKFKDGEFGLVFKLVDCAVSEHTISIGGMTRE